MENDKKNYFYQMEKQEVLDEMQSAESGLSMEDASWRLERDGENSLQEEKPKPVWKIFLGQFCDLLVIILIAAAIISMLSGNVESTIVIFVVIILNAVLGTVQYVKAGKTLAALKALSAPHAKVLRDGERMEIPSNLVVPGDILQLEAGDMITADGRILQNYSLQVNESSLTGESTAVDKNDKKIEGEVPLAERSNMVFSGSLVTYGRATVLVTGTGMGTEIGKIAQLLNATKEKRTPLQISLDDFSRKLAIVILIICAIVFGLGLYRKMPILDSLMFAVALAVAAIPEALGSIVTIVQAMGTQKMAKENAIIKELKAVESLGCVSVICSDKTGTLTQNKMVVQNLYVNGQTLTPEDLKPEGSGPENELHKKLLLGSLLCNDSAVTRGKGIGDPTELCLLEMAMKIGFTGADNIPRMEELPFDSDRKLMSTKNKIEDKVIVFTKGAVDVLLGRITSIACSDGVRPFTQQDKDDILEQNLQFSKQGLRVLAFVYKETTKEETLSLENERDYVFLGLISMMDPPREESAAAVENAKHAGIRTIMITGDHKITATAIAEQIGIFKEGDMSLTGMELDAYSDEQLERDLEKISVYSRVSPENKIRIVNAWQKKHHIVAMTGDGVNDAPALKKADIGVAMGITGTEVSKDAAAMILADDNFATIIQAVLNGRNVYRNIKNAIQFLLSGNMAGILTVLYCALWALPTPFAPVQLLFMNLVTDSLPALAIGMEPSEKSLLMEKPRDPGKGILTRIFMGRLLWQGGLITIATVSAFYLGLKESSAMACTMAFATLTLSRLLHGFNCRSDKSIFKIGLFSNKWSVGAFAIGVILLHIVLFVPGVKGLFFVSNLGIMELIQIYILSLVPTVIIQLVKLIKITG